MDSFTKDVGMKKSEFKKKTYYYSFLYIVYEIENSRALASSYFKENKIKNI